MIFDRYLAGNLAQRFSRTILRGFLLAPVDGLFGFRYLPTWTACLEENRGAT